MNLWRGALWLTAKDLRSYFRDRIGMLLGFLMPVGLVAVFGFVMTFAFGGGSAMPRVTLWVADGDVSPASARLVEALRAFDMLRVRPGADDPALLPDAAAAKVRDGDAHHVLVVPAGFGADLAAGRPPALQLIHDPGRVMEHQIVGIGVAQAFLAASEGRLWPQMIGSVLQRMGMGAERAAQLVSAAERMQEVIRGWAGRDPEPAPEPAAGAGGAAAGADADFDFHSMMTGLVPLTQREIRPPSRPKQLTYQVAQSVSGMTVMMLMFGLMACGTTLLQERERGTMRRLLAAPLPRGSVLLGKFLFSFLVGMLQLAVLFSFGEVMFGVGTFRDPITLLVLSATWSACATAFGLLIAAWASTQKQAEGLSVLLILVMAALGGCWFPVQIADLPWYAEAVMRGTLTWWAMTGYQGMFWQQWSFLHPTMLGALAVQWGFTLVATAAALALFRRRYVGG